MAFLLFNWTIFFCTWNLQSNGRSQLQKENDGLIGSKSSSLSLFSHKQKRTLFKFQYEFLLHNFNIKQFPLWNGVVREDAWCLFFLAVYSYGTEISFKLWAFMLKTKISDLPSLSQCFFINVFHSPWEEKGIIILHLFQHRPLFYQWLSLFPPESGERERHKTPLITLTYQKYKRNFCAKVETERGNLNFSSRMEKFQKASGFQIYLRTSREQGLIKNWLLSRQVCK